MARQQRLATPTEPGRTWEILRISHEEVDRFCRLSHDRNPLHTDAGYARRTPFGSPVVFGMLTALRGLAGAGERPGRQLLRLMLDLRSPVFADTSYALSVVEPSEAESTIVLKDGDRTVLRGRATYGSGVSGVPTGGTGTPTTRREPADRDPHELRVGTAVHGRYQPDPDAVRQLVSRLSLQPMGVSVGHVALIALLSYLVGMEVPGQRALFSAAELDIHGVAADSDALLDYDLVVTAFDTRLGLARLRVDVRCGEARVATAQLRAIVRGNVPTLDVAARDQLLAPSDALKGRTAVVIGGSRGLGAAIASALASQGARVVVGYQRSHAAARQLLHDTERLPGAVELRSGDAADPAWCAGLCAHVGDTDGGLDLLVSNASHSLQPLSVHPLTVERLNAYVHDSLRLVGVPFAHACMLLAPAVGAT